MIRWSLAGILACTLLLSSAQKVAASEQTLLLVSEQLRNGSKLFWWKCEGVRPTHPVLDRLTPRLSEYGLDVTDRCDELDPPIHSSYRKPDLLRHERLNVANALDVRRLISGSIARQQKRRISELGLEHVTIRVTLTALDVHTEQIVGTLNATAEGFAATVEDADARAVELVLARLRPRLSQLAAQPVIVAAPTLRVWISALAKPSDLEALEQTLRAVPDLASLKVLEITRDAALIEIQPVSLREAVLSALEAANAQAHIDGEAPTPIPEEQADQAPAESGPAEEDTKEESRRGTAPAPVATSEESDDNDAPASAGLPPEPPAPNEAVDASPGER